MDEVLLDADSEHTQLPSWGVCSTSRACGRTFNARITLRRCCSAFARGKRRLWVEDEELLRFTTQ